MNKLIKRKSVNKMLDKSEINAILDEIDKADVIDLGVVYRTSEGKIFRLWFGDNISLHTMVGMLLKDINFEIESLDCIEDKEE